MVEESSAQPVGATAAERAPSRGGEAAMMLVELLPEWYPRTVRRRRWLKAQAVATGLLVLVFAVALILRTEDVAASRLQLEQIQIERARVNGLLTQLEASQEELEALTAEAELLSQIGLPFEVSRLFAEIERLMPETMALDGLSVSTVERRPTAPEIARARREDRPEPEPSIVMQFSLTGSATSHADIEKLKGVLAALHLPGEPTPKTIGSAGPEQGSGLRFDLYFEVSLAAGDYMPGAATVVSYSH